MAEGSGPARVPGRLRTAVALLAVDAGLRLLGFARVDALLGGGSPGTPVPVRTDWPSAGQQALARALARRIERAAGLRLYRVPCLPRALLLRRWLISRGLPATLRIGARREGPLFRAHAWVECGAEVLDPDPAVGERFPPLRG